MQILDATSQRSNSSSRIYLSGLVASLTAAWIMVQAGTARGQDVSTNDVPVDPVLSLMLEKGMINKTDAALVQAQLDARRTNMINEIEAKNPASVWKISKGIKSVELFGDIRLRYESRTATDPKGGDINLQRYRYSIRVGLRGEVFNDFYYGLRLETSQNPRSSFATFGSSQNSGPFNKNENGSAAIEVGQAYLGWKPDDWAEVTLGKMPNPLFTTSMVWSGSINPEGAAERFKYTVGDADFFVTFGQFIYQDTNPDQASAGYFSSGSKSGSISSYTPFLLAWQGGVNFHLTKDISLKVAPVIYQYTAFNNGKLPPDSGSLTSPDISYAYVGQGTTVGLNGKPASYNLGGPYNGYYANQSGINDLLVLEFPVELNVQLEKFSLRLFGDYAQNLDGVNRANAAYDASHSFYYTVSGPGAGTISQISSPQTGDTKAYQVGLAIGSKDSLGLVNGSVSKRHAWEVRTYWQHIEQYSLDPNLIDTDFFNGNENMQGIYAAVAYGFSDNIIGTFRYGYANRINDKLGTGGSSPDIPQMNPVNSYSILQADMTFKF